MSDKALVVRTEMDVMSLGKVLVESGFFQDSKSAAQAVVKVIAGQELGFGPVASMTGIYIVKGRVSLSANLMAAAIKRAGKYNYRITEHTETTCAIAFYESGEAVGTSVFTIQDARKAGLVASGGNWDKYPKNMLFARALSNGAKWFCADVFGGPVYTPDEMGATVDGETGEVIEGTYTTPAAVTPPEPPAPAVVEPVEPPDLKNMAPEAAAKFLQHLPATEAASSELDEHFGPRPATWNPADDASLLDAGSWAKLNGWMCLNMSNIEAPAHAANALWVSIGEHVEDLLEDERAQATMRVVVDEHSFARLFKAKLTVADVFAAIQAHYAAKDAA